MDNIENNKLPEILAPAGDLETAICAFDAGADAVYLGLRDFSARGAAVNFTLSDLRRLKFEADLHDKKIYVTINTLIKDSELKTLISLVSEVELIGVDAVIVQDLGALKLIRKYFPTLEVHASTQMAVGDLPGLLELKKLGVSRAILPRETTFSELKKLSKESPIELETFIHGAMCYSYSGQCLASGLLLNRSGNRGQCAQVCRNYFDFYGNNVYPFSCNDMALEKDILKLKELGVSSLKIEGRLKSKEYVSRVVTLYRNILDKPNLSNRKLDELVRNVTLSFARKKTKGYFYQSSGEDLVNRYYPKNIGEYVGKVKSLEKNRITLEKPFKLNAKDRLIALNSLFNKKSRSLQVLRVDKKSDSFIFYGNGIKKDDEIYRIGSSELRDLKSININDYPEKKVNVNAEFEFSDSDVTVSCKVLKRSVKFKRELDVQPSKGVTTISFNLNKQFEKSDKSRFQITVKNRGEENLFVPPSLLKKLRKDFYSTLDKLFCDLTSKKVDTILNSLSYITGELNPDLKRFVSKRGNLNPKDGDIPFALPEHLDSIGNFANFSNYLFIPLPSFGLDFDLYEDKLRSLADENRDKTLVVGLNNISHQGFLDRFKSVDNISHFFDAYFYVANNFTLLDLPEPLFFYSWVEQGSVKHPLSVELKHKNDLPFMISKGCYHKHVLSEGKCPKKCRKSYSYDLAENKNRFKVIVKDCITYLFSK